MNGAGLFAIDARWRKSLSGGWPGLLLSVVIAIASAFIADHRGGPLVYALLLGMALNPVAMEGAAKPGVDFAAGRILRFGIALLGARITFDQIGALEWHSGTLIGPRDLSGVCRPEPRVQRSCVHRSSLTYSDKLTSSSLRQCSFAPHILTSWI